MYLIKTHTQGYFKSPANLIAIQDLSLIEKDKKKLKPVKKILQTYLRTPVSM